MGNDPFPLLKNSEIKGSEGDIEDIKNTPQYYECYLRFGEYADFQKIIKK